MEIIKMPEHLRRIDLTKILSFQSDFVNETCCGSCPSYHACLEYGVSQTKKPIHDIDKESGREKLVSVKQCVIGRAYDEYIQLRRLFTENNRRLLTKETLNDYIGNKSYDNVKKLKVIANTDSSFEVHSYKQNCYIYGETNCQKTAMAKALAKKLCYPMAKERAGNKAISERSSFDVRYINMNYLMSLLMKARDNSFGRNTDSTNQDELDTIKNATWLFIDDAFDARKAIIYKSTDDKPAYLSQDLYSFLQDRLEDHYKGTVLISQVSPDKLDRDYFDESLSTLLTRNIDEILEFKDKYSSNGIPTRQVNI